MRCVQPYRAFRSRARTAKGKNVISGRRVHSEDTPIALPCGSCLPCKLERARQHAVCCMHEASLSEANCFVSLTYDEESLPFGGSLVREHLRDFIKRVRKRYVYRYPNLDVVRAGCVKRIRYFACGEYGERYARPHYHILFFGFDFPDKRKFCRREGFDIFRSDGLESLWTFGRSEIGAVSFASAGYVAGYVASKLDERVLGDREEEFCVMSQSIGIEWFQRWHPSVVARDSVIVNGVEASIPRRYQKYLEGADPVALKKLKRQREAARLVEMYRVGEYGAMSDEEVLLYGVHRDETDERLVAQEEFLRGRLNLRRRDL